MKNVVNHLAEVLLALAAIILCIAVVNFTAPGLTGALGQMNDTLTSKGQDMLNSISTPNAGGNGGSGGTGGSEEEPDEPDFVPGLYQTGAIDFYNTYGTSKPAPEMNEYGFYFGEEYYDVAGMLCFVFYEDGAFEVLIDGFPVDSAPAGSLIYSNLAASLEGETFGTFSFDGKQFDDGSETYTIKYTTAELSDMLIMSWDDLVANGYVAVEDGVLMEAYRHTGGRSIAPASSCGIGGDLLLPSDGSITSVGDSTLQHTDMGAFRYCENLTGILIPNSVTSIGSGAFMECSKLTNITIPAGVTTIGVGSFSYCQSLKTITVPATVTSIGTDAFYSENLVAIYYAGTQEQWDKLGYSIVNDILVCNHIAE